MRLDYATAQTTAVIVPMKAGKHVRHDRYGTQAYFVHRGEFISTRWKARDFSKAEREAKAREWLKNADAAITLNQPIPDTRGPLFEDDAGTYLAAVTSMPSFSDRVRDIRYWVVVFRGRERNSITALEIRTQLERWRTAGAAPSTCNKRRTALMSFFTEMNGRSGYNPVRDVPKYEEDNDEPRAQHPVTILRVLALMRRPLVRARKDGRRTLGPKRETPTLARLLVILTTGWPHAIVKKLKPEHLDLKHGRAFVKPRQKGKKKGRKPRWLPLLPAAVNALKMFDRLDCYTKTVNGKPKPFSNSAMNSSFARALARLNAHRARLKLPPLHIRPYDLRHTFGTWLAHRLTDERAIQELMLHSRIEQQRRYNDAATAGRVDRAMAPLMTSKLARIEAESAGNRRDRTGKTKGERRRKT